MAQYYSINDICMFTGLSDRTIRTYIRNGLLRGEMIDRAWAFTEEQVTAFMKHPSVLPSIQAKKHALVTDFMLDNHKKTSQICVLWDIPNRNGQSINDFLCKKICEDESLSNFHYSYENFDLHTRLIMKGEAKDIANLIQQLQNHL